MEHELHEGIRALSKLAREQLQSGKKPSDPELHNLSEQFDQYVQQIGEAVQQKIYNIQVRKQEIMQHLKEQLACLDDPNCRLEKTKNTREAQFDQATRTFTYRDDAGIQRTASFGALVADIDWGVYYSLENTPRSFIKKYLVECAKHALRELFDLQIIKYATGSNTKNAVLQNTYATIERERGDGVQNKRWGIIAEKMAKNFLKKLSIDNNLPFEVIESDIFQNVEQKIDFIIRRKAPPQRAVGIQFSVSYESAKKKRVQIEKSAKRLKEQGERIQDIALVIFPRIKTKKLISQWRKGARIAGGLDMLLPRHTAHELFAALLQSICTKEEIEDAWSKVRDTFSEDITIASHEHLASASSDTSVT